MLPSPRASLGFLTIAITVMGAGCWSPFRKNAELQPAEYSSSTANPSLPKNTAPTEDDVRTDLQAAMQNFNSAKSFRSNVTLKTSEGTFKAKMDFAKPDRVRGDITLRPGTKVDMIFAEKELFIRFNKDPWANISKIPSAQSIATAMKDSLTGQLSLDHLGIDPNLSVKRTADRSRKCDLYRTTLTDEERRAYEVEICVADGYPKFLEIKSATNPLAIEYYDYNAVFLIEKPRD